MPAAELITPSWGAPANVRGLLTTRRGGASTGAFSGFNLALHTGDDAGVVHAHRAQLLSAAQLTSACWLNQVHGINVVEATTKQAHPPRADASIARQPNVACVVMMADCLPVLICDDAGTVVAAAHCGWRGLTGGLLEELVARLGLPPHQLMAWFGPAISALHYEVGEDVHRAVADRFSQEVVAATMRSSALEGKWWLDLAALARAQLGQLGVARISDCGYCTYDDPRFYSYRRDGITGRMAALIWLTDRA